MTFRLPNSKVENEFRLGRALIGMLSSASMAKKIGMHSPPLFEVILPMTESAQEMLGIQEAFKEIAELIRPFLTSAELEAAISHGVIAQGADSPGQRETKRPV